MPANTYTNLLPGGGAGGQDTPPQKEWSNPKWGEGTGPVIEGFGEGVKDRLIDDATSTIPDVPIVKGAAATALEDFKKPLPEGGGGTSVIGWFLGYVLVGVAIALAGEGISRLPETRPTPPAPESSIGAWRRWRYEKSPKHGPKKKGAIGAAPKNGQEVLDTATTVNVGDTKRLIGVDPKTGEYVVFDETHIGQGIYHGHVRTWEELTDEMRQALIEGGFVDRRGRILVN
jgi:hypothetical protein